MCSHTPGMLWWIATSTHPHDHPGMWYMLEVLVRHPGWKVSLALLKTNLLNDGFSKPVKCRGFTDGSINAVVFRVSSDDGVFMMGQIHISMRWCPWKEWSPHWLVFTMQWCPWKEWSTHWLVFTTFHCWLLPVPKYHGVHPCMFTAFDV